MYAKKSHAYLIVHLLAYGPPWCAVFTQMQDEGFFLKFGAYMYEVILNSHMKHRTGPRQTRSLSTGPSGVKPRPASRNLHLRSPLFWDITQRRPVIPYRRFGTICPIFKGQEIRNREQSTNEVSWHSLLVWEFLHRLIFLKKHDFSEVLSVSIFREKSS
jgi:hypothetical protein